MKMIFHIIKTSLIYFLFLGFTLNARPQKRQRFNHYRVEIKVVVLYCSFVNGSEKIAYVQFSYQDPAFTSEKLFYVIACR